VRPSRFMRSTTMQVVSGARRPGRCRRGRRGRSGGLSSVGGTPRPDGSGAVRSTFPRAGGQPGAGSRPEDPGGGPLPPVRALLGHGCESPTIANSLGGARRTAACGRREQESRRAWQAETPARADSVRAARAAPGTCNRPHRRRRSGRAPASAAPPPMPEGMGLRWKGNHGTRATPSLRRHRGGAQQQPLAVRRAGVAASDKGLTGNAGGGTRPRGHRPRRPRRTGHVQACTSAPPVRTGTRIRSTTSRAGGPGTQVERESPDARACESAATPGRCVWATSGRSACRRGRLPARTFRSPCDATGGEEADPAVPPVSPPAPGTAARATTPAPTPPPRSPARRSRRPGSAAPSRPGRSRSPRRAGRRPSPR